MNICECQDLAKRLYPAELSFKLATPAGKFDAKWLDPYFGLFLVPSVSPGHVSVGALQHCAHDCAEITVTPVGGTPAPYLACEQT
jgi:hypothetical protein